jgi:RNA polymerase-binding transcription factor DksA
MNKKRLEHYRDQLRSLIFRVQGTATDLEEGARQATGGDAGGSLSNAPLHLGDVGTGVYMQELNATLLENEVYLRDEVRAALGRIDQGTYGKCERCGTKIPEVRLDAIPYTRFCVDCAELEQSGIATDFNAGRPGARGDIAQTRSRPPQVERSQAGDEPPFTNLATPAERHQDTHAVGTAGGGTAVGGLAGTNIGEGDPDEANLEEATASSKFDTEIESEEKPTTAYSGPHGGAVGGTPANKRATGGRVKPD